jgi:hypothetical protein
MADIDVVPKQRSNTWLWIVLAIVAIAVLVWLLAARPQTTTTDLRQGHPALVSSVTALRPAAA